ncbi:MAG: hypothetical protein WC291_02640 [Thermodesulfovibrionales bacterium]
MLGKYELGNLARLNKGEKMTPHKMKALRVRNQSKWKQAQKDKVQNLFAAIKAALEEGDLVEATRLLHKSDKQDWIKGHPVGRQWLGAVSIEFDSKGDFQMRIPPPVY